MEELDDLDGIKRNTEAVAVMMVYSAPGKHGEMYYSPEDIASALIPVRVSTRHPQKFGAKQPKY